MSISAERNFAYLQVQKKAVAFSLAAGVALWCSFFVGCYSLTKPIFDVVWGIHLLLQAAAVGFVLRLIVMYLKVPLRLDVGLYTSGFLLVLLYEVGLGVLPIVSRDALIYHLEVPKLWLAAGKIVEIGWHEWSHFPLFLSLSYTGFEKFGLAQLTPFYHLSYLILAAGAVASFVYYKLQDEEYALLSAWLLLTLPICLKLGAEPMSDLGLAFYFGLGFALFVFWGEQRGGAKMLLSIGLALGLALGTKYNALLAMSLFFLCMVSFLQRWSFTLGEIGKYLAIIAGIALVLYLPWPIKNYIHTGNPFYPFADSIFGVSDEMPFIGSVRPIAYRMGAYGEDLRAIALIPFRMMLTGEDDSPRQFDGLLSPVLLLALLTLVKYRRGERQAPWILNTWLLVGSYFLVSLNAFYALVRYQAPLLVPAVALTICGAAVIGGERESRQKRAMCRAIFAVQLVWAGWYGYRTIERVQPYGVWLGRESRETYLQRRVDEYNTARFVNLSLPEDAVVYLLFTGNRYYFYDRDVRGSYFSQQPIVRCLSEEATAEHLATCFRELGTTHIAIHLNRTKQTLDISLNDEQKNAWTEFVKKYLELVYKDRFQTVWKIRPLSSG